MLAWHQTEMLHTSSWQQRSSQGRFQKYAGFSAEAPNMSLVTRPYSVILKTKVAKVCTCKQQGSLLHVDVYNMLQGAPYLQGLEAEVLGRPC